MLYISIIRDNPEKFDKRFYPEGLKDVTTVYLRWGAGGGGQAQELQTKRNETSKQIGQAKAAKDEDLVKKLMDDVARMKEQLQRAQELEREASQALENALADPNIPLKMSQRNR